MRSARHRTQPQQDGNEDYDNEDGQPANIFCPGYGLTETFGAVTITPYKTDEADSVGVPLPMSEVKVRVHLFLLSLICYLPVLYIKP